MLEHLIKCTANNWLGSQSQELLDLTEKRLQKLRSQQSNFSTKLNIFIVETQPIKFLAALLAGIIVRANIFLCNPNWQETEWHQVLNLVKPDLIFAETKIEQYILSINIKDRRVIEENTLSDREDIIAIATGGTSGKIKFALHNLSTIIASVFGFRDYFQSERVNSCCLLPLYHVSGLMQFFRSFLTGGKLELIDYKLLKQNIQSPPIYRDFFISIVPTQLQFFLEHNPKWLAEFQTVLIGGAPVGETLLERARKARIPLALTYGMTETAAQIATLKPDDFFQGNNSSGKILPHARIKILKTSDRVGLIQIEADSLCLGYYPQLFERRALLTDDLGYLDKRGYLHIVGRNSHTIITGGEKVLPTEVETAILTTKLVRDVCVVGISDERWGQIVTALCVPLQPEPNFQSIQQQLRTKIGNYKIPKYWIAVDRLPYSDRGKIDYRRVESIARNWLLKQTEK
jgi:o-succinylbenzoate---CoA ligase